MNSKIEYQTFVISILTFCISFFGIILFSMVIIDPLKIFHKPLKDSINFMKGEMRYQVAGIINNYEFDSIILGASMLQNTSAKDATDILQSSFVNLSVGGLSMGNRSLMIDYALKSKKLNHVITTLDGFADSENKSNFSFLYNGTFLDDIKVYKTRRFVIDAVCQLSTIYVEIAYCKKRNSYDTSLELITEWYSTYDHKERFGGIENWLKLENNSQIIDQLEEIAEQANCIKNNYCEAIKSSTYDNAIGIFDKTILKLALENSDTKFHLIFPPYSRLKYALLKQSNSNEFESYITTIKNIVMRSEAIENISIYGMDHLTFSDDISNYKDPSHYHPRVNQEMLKAIKNNHFLLTSQTLNSYIEEIESLAKNYDIFLITNQIESYLRGLEI